LSDGPLAGLRVAVTRPEGRGGRLPALLREQGAEVVRLVVSRLADPVDPAAVDAAIEGLRARRWDRLILTSAAAVERFSARTVGLGLAVEAWPPVIVVGSATADALRKLGLAPALVPASFRAEGVVEAVLAEQGPDLGGMKLLLPRAESGRPVLAEGLRAAGASVDEVVLYQTVAAGRELARELEPVDVVTVAAGSAARHLVEAVGAAALRGKVLASIGPVTSQECVRLGLSVGIEADEARLEALVKALVAWRSR
jgi:uroporphyrinogen III methyltransferase/synthase